MADLLRLFDVNAGGLRLKKGQGILHLNRSINEFRGLSRDWVGGKILFMRSGVNPCGGEQNTHINRIPRESQDNPVKFCLCAFFFGVPLASNLCCLFFIVGRYDWTTGGPHDGNEWKKYRVVPHAHPSRTLPYVSFNGSVSKDAFSFPEAT